MPNDLLLNLLKAGGTSALAIGVIYLLYREIIKLGIFPKLKQWQGFALLCLLAAFVFVIAMTVLLPRGKGQALLDGELPPVNHFQLDAREGVFCEQKNVHQPFAQFFDSIEINMGACNGSDQYASRSYRVDWQPLHANTTSTSTRRNYQHCFASDFAERAPAFLQRMKSSFEEAKQAIPCKVSMYLMRQIRISYVDLRNESKEAAFLQFYNRGGAGRFEIEQVGTTNLARSDQMEALLQTPDGGVELAQLLTIAGQYRFPGIPRQ